MGAAAPGTPAETTVQAAVPLRTRGTIVLEYTCWSIRISGGMREATMDLLFVTSSAALGTAVAGTLQSAGHTVDVASDARQLDEAFRIAASLHDQDLPQRTPPGEARRAGWDGRDGRGGHAPKPYDAVLLDDLTDPELMGRLAQLLQPHPADGDADGGESHARPLPKIALLATPSMPRGREQTSRYAIDDPASPLHPSVTINKPFSDAELLSYVELLSPGHAGSDGPALLIHGDLTLDTRAQRAYYRSASRPIALSPREYSALEALIRADGRFLSFDDLSRLVFGDGVGFAEQRDVMATTLYSLTRKMRRLGFFITQRGHEYRIR
ncbi:transcriptional regulator [Bifidobacterium miconis]|uniref:transcriptional regulator n=1 Tax=Bifidobacterium miconis TaxID=2834435 RepID=UPI001F34510C|nr:transcriptional regulator [Bifidobacterium miconis]